MRLFAGLLLGLTLSAAVHAGAQLEEPLADKVRSAVLLSNVPVFDETRDNAARRFISLIDELYDRGVNLAVSAAARSAALRISRRDSAIGSSPGTDSSAKSA